MAQLELRIREIDLAGQGICLEASDIPGQLQRLIAQYGSQSIPLLPGFIHERRLHDPNDHPGTRVVIAVRMDAEDATCVRIPSEYTGTIVSPDQLDMILDDPRYNGTRRMSVAKRPVYFIGSDGNTIERIIYRRS